MNAYLSLFRMTHNMADVDEDTAFTTEELNLNVL